MMTQVQLRRFITEVAMLFVLAAGLVVGGYFFSQDNANRRLQNEYHARFDPVLDSYSYEKIKSSAQDDYAEIDGVYIGYSATGLPEGYVIDLTVQSPGGQDLSMLVALDYESTRIIDFALNPAEGENAYTISDEDMELIKEQLTGRQIPVAFEVEDIPDDDDKGAVIVAGLHDGVYYAQRLFDDRNKYIDYVEMEIENGVITKVKWDAFSTDSTNQDRSEASLKGAYEVSGLDWATQSYNLCHALLEYQDPDNLAMKSDGTTDIVDGVTCDIRPFIDLAQECITNSRASYDKNSYMGGLNTMLTSLFEKDAEELGYINKDGHIVFSFEKNPELYTVYNDDGVAVGYMGVKQIVSSINGTAPLDGATDIQEPEDQPEEYQNSGSSDFDTAEDGVVPDGNIDEQYFTDTLDDLPMTEMASFVTPDPECYEQTRTVVKACNTCYKFLKEYLNWKV